MGNMPLDQARWPFIALLASAGMLAAAHAFERFMLLAPCPLCYNQRQVYWVAGVVALAAVMVNWRGASRKTASLLCFLLALVFLTGFGVASYHSLVEWGVLPAPPTCAAGAVRVSGDLWEQLSKPMAVPSCDKALWHFLGLSMAAWNALISLALAAGSIYCALRNRRMMTDTANEPGEAPATETAGT
jgi:disulfide bond formation protein DsbB